MKKKSFERGNTNILVKFLWKKIENGRMARFSRKRVIKNCYFYLFFLAISISISDSSLKSYEVTLQHMPGRQNDSQ